VAINIQLCGEGQLCIGSLLVLVPPDVQHSRACSGWQQVTSSPNLGQHITIRSLVEFGVLFHSASTSWLEATMLLLSQYNQDSLGVPVTKLYTRKINRMTDSIP